MLECWESITSTQRRPSSDPFRRLRGGYFVQTLAIGLLFGNIDCEWLDSSSYRASWLSSFSCLIASSVISPTTFFSTTRLFLADWDKNHAVSSKKKKDRIFGRPPFGFFFHWRTDQFLVRLFLFSCLYFFRVCPEASQETRLACWLRSTFPSIWALTKRSDRLTFGLFAAPTPFPT